MDMAEVMPTIIRTGGLSALMVMMAKLTGQQRILLLLQLKWKYLLQRWSGRIEVHSPLWKVIWQLREREVSF